MNTVNENEMFASPDTWLFNVGYISENAEQNLILYGYLSAKGVINVELMIDVDNWLIRYMVVFGTREHSKYKIQKYLESKTSLFYKLVLFCFLKVFGNYDPCGRIARCVKDYAGKKWKTQVEVMSVRQYNKATNDGGSQSWFFKGRVDEGGKLHKTEGTDPSCPSSMR